MTQPIPTSEQTKSAPVDALLIARMFCNHDDTATTVMLKHCDPYSTTLQLAGWLRAAIDTALAHGAGSECGDQSVDDVLDRWLTKVRQEAGQ